MYRGYPLVGGFHHQFVRGVNGSVLLRVVGIMIVDVPTWFHHEQEKNNASRGYHRERN